MNGTLAYAVRHGLLAANPCAGLTPDDWPRASERKTYEWSDREIEVLLLVALESVSENIHLILLAAVDTGLRLSELLGLRWGDVDLEEGVLHVRHQLSRSGSYEEPKTKAGKRRVPLGEDIADALGASRFASNYPRDDDPVFAGVDGRPLQHRGVQRGFDSAREKARKRPRLSGAYQHDDGSPVTFHDLRHAFASRCASRGVPVGTPLRDHGPCERRHYPEHLHSPIRTRGS